MVRYLRAADSADFTFSGGDPGVGCTGVSKSGVPLNCRHSAQQEGIKGQDNSVDSPTPPRLSEREPHLGGGD